jgi:two-component system nitrate/nitrite sensor histidine kinase NarX
MPRQRRLTLPSWHSLESSLLVRIGGAIAAIAMLAVVGMAVSALVAESTQGSGEAINLAGSLRMKSWQMTSLYLTAEENPDLSGEHMRGAVRDFDATLESAPVRSIMGYVGDDRLLLSYEQVRQEWQASIRPQFLALAEDPLAVPTTGQRSALLRDVSQFVDHINDLVKRMEETTEAKIMVMRVVLGVALALTVLVVLLTIHLIHTQLVQPLRDLLKFAAEVGQGNLSSRTGHTGEDELGQLGSAFNLMAEDLSKLYQDLEGRVQQKTAELTRSNHALELLYTAIARLHGAPPGRETYLAVLRDIEQMLGLGHGIICIGDPGGSTGTAIANTMQAGDDCPCDTANCRWCHGTEQTRFSISDNFHQHLTLPLADAGQQYGVLILEVPGGRQLEAWQVQLLEALSRHIGVAIGAEQQIEKNRRLALLEERAVIARELHDSLAQSLAYMKIQVSRMKSAMRNGLSDDKVGAVLEELRDGLNSAYRQLRELLSSFRLKMEDEPLAAILARTVEEFAERGGLAIDLELDMEDCPLSPNEEIHVLHIVREALSNVLHHANARHARVSLRCGGEAGMAVVVEDDGVGIVKPADVHHYGMTIMEERARTLRGRVRYEGRPEGGTRVALDFTPHSLRKNAVSEREVA